MAQEPISILSVIQSQFPELYQAEGQNMIAFVEAYYEWLEQSGYAASNQLLNLRDIDATVDDFVVHFKNEYLTALPSITEGSVRTFIKHANDFYNVRGTPAGIKLFFRLLYGAEADVYIPGNDILKLSDGTWFVPLYLEVSLSSLTNSFIGQVIHGSISGATAYVESVVRKFVAGAYFDVVYISALTGNFVINDIITTDGNLTGCPTVIGSLTQVLIENGGENNNIGDIFQVTSLYGRQGLARVANTTSGTGRVNFNLVDGGTGYTINADAIVSNTVLLIANTQNANVLQTFIPFEVVTQRLANIAFLSANNNWSIGQTVEGWTSGTWIKQADGVIVGLTQNNANGTMVVACNTAYDEYFFADTLRAVGNGISAVVSSFGEVDATGQVVGFTANAIGLYNTNNNFYVGNGCYILGQQSNTTANLTGFTTGFGATFDIGAISPSETVLVNTDFISGNNVANVPYIYIQLNGQGSGVGIVANVSVGKILHVTGINGVFTANDLVFQANSTQTYATGQVYFSNSTVVSVYTLTGTFSTANTVQDSTSGANATVNSITIDGGTGFVNNDVVTFLGGGDSVTSTTIVAPGQHYANGERVIFSSATGILPVAVVETNASGNITSLSYFTDGQFLIVPPTMTVNTAAGTGANLVAVMGDATPANGTVSTNSTGGLVSIAITNTGSSYFYVPTLSFPHGSGENYLVNMVFGYGFPKDPFGGNTTPMLALLTYVQETIGTIISLSGIDPGSNYNFNPFVRVVEPEIAGYDKRDFIVTVANTVGLFDVGEVLNESFTAPAVKLTYTGLVGNTSFEVGEYIYQTSTGANGTVLATNSTVVEVGSVTGTFVNTTSVPSQITSDITNATANVANVANFSLITTAAGYLKSQTVSGSNATLYIRRQTFNETFGVGSLISGVTSGATGNVQSVIQDPTTLAMGNNAIVTANVSIANGIATQVQIISSGFGFEPQEQVTLTNANNNFVITGIANVVNQGIGEGYWTSTKGFLDSDKYIQDDFYYQVFSYEIQTSISLDTYANIVKRVLHVAGLQMFGRTIIKTSESIPVTVNQSILTQH